MWHGARWLLRCEIEYDETAEEVYEGVTDWDEAYDATLGESNRDTRSSLCANRSSCRFLNTKFSPTVSSSRCKGARLERLTSKDHRTFVASSQDRPGARAAKKLQRESIPVRRDDDVVIMRGHYHQ